MMGVFSGAYGRRGRGRMAGGRDMGGKTFSRVTVMVARGRSGS